MHGFVDFDTHRQASATMKAMDKTMFMVNGSVIRVYFASSKDERRKHQRKIADRQKRSSYGKENIAPQSQNRNDVDVPEVWKAL